MTSLGNMVEDSLPTYAHSTTVISGCKGVKTDGRHIKMIYIKVDWRRRDNQGGKEAMRT